MLTGGLSTRMGEDKALVDVDGRPLAGIAADALHAAGADEVFGVGGNVQALEAAGLRVVPDLWPGEGPLGGILTALDAATADVVVVLACDLPGVTAEAVHAVLDGLGDADVAVPMVEGRAQHLLAAWRRSACRERLADAFQSGERAIWRAGEGLCVARVTLRDGSWARDADDPDALFRQR